MQALSNRISKATEKEKSITFRNLISEVNVIEMLLRNLPADDLDENSSSLLNELLVLLDDFLVKYEGHTEPPLFSLFLWTQSQYEQ